MFVTSQPDGCKNLICYKKLIAAENLKDLLEGLSCNKSCQGTKKTDAALSNCCLSISLPAAVPRLYLAQCSATGCAAWGSWCGGPRAKLQTLQGFASDQPLSERTSALDHIPTTCSSWVHLKGIGSVHSEMSLQCKPRYEKEAIRGFTSKSRSHPNRSSTIDTATCT